MDIYLVMLQAMNFLYEIMDRDIPEGRKNLANMKKGTRFVASIISLYLLVKPKLKYVPDKKYDKLKELDDYYFGRKDLTTMTFLEARVYLDLLRDFIEALGITAFEVERLSGSQTVVKEMVED